MTEGWPDLIGDLKEAEHRQLVMGLPSEAVGVAAATFPWWAHDGQVVRPDDPLAARWRTWVIMAGRGFGKTLAGAEWVTAQVATNEPIEIALVGATIEDARRVMVEGRSGLLNVAAEWIAEWRPSLHQIVFTTGAVATLFSGASPNRLRGPEHHLAWCDELAKWEKAADSWDMLQLGLRLGERPRALITTTPRAGALLSAIIAEPDTLLTGGATDANPHTPAAFKARVHGLYAGTRLGAQELEGRLLTDAAGALWTVALLERCRARGERAGAVFAFTRICIGVDPPSGDGTCGIVVCALDEAGRAHVLADHSVTARTPEGWARAVADAARAHGDAPVLVVAETNQGGRMVKTILHTADPNLHVKPVTASLSKSDRAAPVAHLFEAGKVDLHGRFPELEAELCGLIAGGGYEGSGVSPNRADAMVWALTELMLKERQSPRVSGFA